MTKPIFDIGQICELDKWETFINGQPFDTFKRLREEAPIYWHEESLEFEPGFWALTKHEDIIKVSKDPLTFSSAVGGHLMTMGDPEVVDPAAVAAIIGNMIGMDPPDHQIYRKMVAPSFTPKAIRSLEVDMRLKVRELLDNVSDKGEFNFVTEISEQLPLWVLCEMMGIEESQRPRIRDLVNDLTDASINADPDKSMQVWFNYMELFKMGRDMIEERRKNPTDDLMSVVANTKVEGGELPPELLDGFFLLMVIAGNETTRHSLSHGALALAEFPDQLHRLRESPDLIDTASEEILRWACPQIHFRRTATCDTTLAGVPISAGDKVVTWYISANYDENAFADPFTLDLGRDPNPHVTFGGGGPHICLGAWLARLEVRVFLEEVARRIGRIHLEGEPGRIRSNFINGLKYLPLELQASR